MRVPDVEDDDPGLLARDEDALDGEPHEELLLGEALHAAESALAEVPAHHVVEVGEVTVVVLGVARRRQPRLQQAAGLVQGVRLDAPREQAAGEAVILQELVYRTAGAGGAGDGVPGRAPGERGQRRGEQEEAQDRESGEWRG